MNKNIRVISISSVLAAFAVCLNLLSVRTDTSLYSIYALPLLLAGILFGPLIGLYSGLAAGFIIQLATYGLSPTTPIWMLAPVCWGLSSGIIAKLFKYKLSKLAIISNVIITSLLALLLNSGAMYLDGLIYQYPTDFILLGLGLRVLTAILIGCFYILCLYLASPKLLFLKQFCLRDDK